MSSLKEKIAQRITEKKPLVLSMMAADYGVTELEAAKALPEEMRAFAPKDAFDSVWAELTTWEKATFIVQSKGTVLEVKGAIPPGSYGHGYFNLKSETGIGGHLKVDDLEAVCFMTMPFMGLESLSIQFLNTDGAVKFSIYAGRGEDKKILAPVHESFTRLKAAVCKEGA
ncbi:MAG: Intracellular heme transport protein HutX [Desulfovibrio sp.]